jgi:hypothetical protein
MNDNEFGVILGIILIGLPIAIILYICYRIIDLILSILGKVLLSIFGIFM